MAQTWPAKAPTEIVERRWTVPLAEGDSISGVTTSATGVTVTSDDHQLDEAIVSLSAGTAGTEASVTVTVTTSDGNTHVETFFVAIRATTEAFANTVRDVASFALRKILGLSETADADQLDDAVELFNGMIATWRINGMDVGIAGVLTASDTVDVPDEFIQPIKYCLRKLCHSTYDAPLNPVDAMMAEQGERLISNTLFALTDLSLAGTITRRADSVADPL
jgi:hypothetical protein